MSRLVVRGKLKAVVAAAASMAVAGSLLAFPMAVGAGAQAATLTVNVGGSNADGSVDGQSFYPGLVTVRAGDSVTWRFRGVHTVNFYTPPGDPEAPGVGDGTFNGL